MLASSGHEGQPFQEGKTRPTCRREHEPVLTTTAYARVVAYDELVIERVAFEPTAGSSIYEGADLADVVLNGVPLRTIISATLEEALPPGERSPSGDDLRLVPHLEFARAASPWLQATPRWTQGPWTAVLTCACGVFGCGGIGVRIDQIDDVVVWSDIKDAAWAVNAFWDPDYPYGRWMRAAFDTLGPYRFHREAYRAAVAGVSAR